MLSLLAGYSSETKAQYANYLKETDPHNILLEVQKEADQKRKKIRATMEALELEDTKFLQFQFARLDSVCNKMDVNKKGDYPRVDTLVKEIAQQIRIMADSLGADFDTKSLIRYKFHKEFKALQHLDKKKKDYEVVISRCYGLQRLAFYLGDNAWKRRLDQFWNKRCKGLLG